MTKEMGKWVELGLNVLKYVITAVLGFLGGNAMF